jgi:pimeloyl-ACP methyl ester carboxylesterase
MAALVLHLSPHYTVISYDRRGLSRSKLEDETAGTSIEAHANDAHLLLSALGPETAFVLGISIGALIGLELLARHADQVRTLVAHEPPTTELLRDEERIVASRAREEVEETFRREGVAAAMQRFVAMAGMNPNEREAGLELPLPSPARAANLAFFLRYDAPAARRFRVDLDALKPVASKIVVAAGVTSQAAFPNHCAHALARALGREAREFPGDHSGALLHPRAFAARLREVLGSRPG